MDWNSNSVSVKFVNELNGSGGVFFDHNESPPMLSFDNQVWALECRNVKLGKDFEHLGQLYPKLRFLELVKYPQNNLDVFLNCANLKKVHLYYCSKLTDISSILSIPIEFLWLNNCKNVNIESVGSDHIRELRIFNRNFKSLSFLQNFRNLTRVSLVNVKVEDGDFFSLKELPKLSDVCFTQRKGANCTEDELNAIIQPRGFYQQKIVDLPGGYQTFDAIYL